MPTLPAHVFCCERDPTKQETSRSFALRGLAFSRHTSNPCRLPPTPPAPLQVSLSSFAYLFSELVQYCQSRVSNVGELERK